MPEDWSFQEDRIKELKKRRRVYGAERLQVLERIAKLQEHNNELLDALDKTNTEINTLETIVAEIKSRS